MIPNVEVELKHDFVDLVLTTNISARKKKLEDWGRRKEKEKCRTILDNIKKNKALGKSKQKKVLWFISVEYKIRFYKDESSEV